MWAISSAVNTIFSAIFAPFRSLHPAVGLSALSVITGVVMLLIFGKTSNQSAIRAAKSRLKAHIAEIWLFRDDLLQMLLATARVLVHTGRYFAHSLRPLLFIFIPVMLILVMLGARYEHRPFRAGERAIVAVRVSDPAWATGDRVTLTGTGGVAVSSTPLRIPARGEIDWEIRAQTPGRHSVTLQTPAGSVTKQVLVAADGPAPLTPIAAGRGPAFSSRFLEAPVEAPLAASSGLRSIDVLGWPKRELTMLGLKVNWLVGFFVISLVAGFAVKDLLGVEI
jgi:uncharacterized membrane protein (DUF106 family)